MGLEGYLSIVGKESPDNGLKDAQDVEQQPPNCGSGVLQLPGDVSLHGRFACLMNVAGYALL